MTQIGFGTNATHEDQNPNWIASESIEERGMYAFQLKRHELQISASWKIRNWIC